LTAAGLPTNRIQPVQNAHDRKTLVIAAVTTNELTAIQAPSFMIGPGQVFAVDQEHPHDESIGPEGARVLVGRKYASA
jgi:hypothetical protein